MRIKNYVNGQVVETSSWNVFKQLEFGSYLSSKNLVVKYKFTFKGMFVYTYAEDRFICMNMTSKLRPIKV